MSRLGDFVNIKTGKLDANASSANGQYPFFTCSIEPLRIDAYSYDCECVLVAGNGDLNVKYYNGKFDAYQRTYIIESKNKDVLSVPYLYCFLDKYVEELRKQSIGGVIKYIKLGNLTEAQIPMYSIAEQNEVVANLNQVDTLISIRKQQLSKLDELVKNDSNVRLGKKLYFLVYDFIKSLTDWSKEVQGQYSSYELYTKTWTECRNFVLPMNPQRKELEYAIKSVLSSFGVKIKTNKPKEPKPKDSKQK